MVIGVLAGAFILTVIGLYGWYVSHHITIANNLIDKDGMVADATGWWGWIKAKLIGWKTILVLWFGGLTQGFAYLSSQDWSGLSGLPWVQVFDEKIAGYITIVCFMVGPALHAFGLKTAAETPPVD